MNPFNVSSAGDRGYASSRIGHEHERRVIYARMYAPVILVVPVRIGEAERLVGARSGDRFRDAIHQQVRNDAGKQRTWT